MHFNTCPRTTVSESPRTPGPRTSRIRHTDAAGIGKQHYEAPKKRRRCAHVAIIDWFKIFHDAWITYTRILQMGTGTSQAVLRAKRVTRKVLVDNVYLMVHWFEPPHEVHDNNDDDGSEGQEKRGQKRARSVADGRRASTSRDGPSEVSV